MSDYRIKITIRNDRMLSAMEEMGYVSVASFCKKFNIPYVITAEYFAGKRSALDRHGELKDGVKELLLLLDLTPEQAFTERQLKGFNKTSFEIKTTEDKMLSFMKPPIKNLESLMMEKETHKILDSILNNLSGRERKAIKFRHNIEDCPYTVNKVPTFEEIGLVFKVSKTRAQQIYLNGIHKLRTRDNIELINKSTESSFNFSTMKELKDLKIVKWREKQRSSVLREGQQRVLHDGSIAFKENGKTRVYKDGKKT